MEAAMKTEYRYGPKIKEMRSLRGWTQEHLAEVAGIATRTVQRLEKDDSSGAEGLMAVAQALDTTVERLRTAYWVAERKPLQAMNIEEPEDFMTAIQRAHHCYAYTLLAPLESDFAERVQEVLSELFSDIWAVSPDDEPEFVRCWVDSIRSPLDQLHAMGLRIFSIQECRDVFLKGQKVGERIPVENWTRNDFVAVPKNGCFHLGGRGSKELLHEFNPNCDLAVDAVHRIYRREIEVGLFPNAFQAIIARGDNDQPNWCDRCFPLDSDGARLGYNYMERLTGLSRQELEEKLCAEASSTIIGLA